MEKSQEENKKHPLTREEAEFRKAELIDLTGKYYVNYNLVLTLRRSSDLNKNYQDNNFEGKLIVQFQYFGQRDRDIFLDFHGDVSSVRINGEIVETNYVHRRVFLDRNKLKKASDVDDLQNLNEVVILFSAKYGKGGEGLHHFIDPQDKREYLYTQFESNYCGMVFPVFDQPDIKATLELTLVGPNDWILLSNEYERWTRALNYEDHEVKTIFESSLSLSEEEKSFLFDSILNLNYHLAPFNKTSKISSYLYALCAGPYVCFTDNTHYKVPLKIYSRESLKNSGEHEEMFRVTIAGMEWYKDFFGIPYPFTKYDQIFCPEYNFGAMENVGLVTYNEFYCWKEPPPQQKRARFCITVLHELAHMWFGNLVTMKWWDDLWLNESFATFISFLCQHLAVGEEYPTSWLNFNSSKAFAYAEDQKSTTHPVLGDITDTEKSQAHFDSIVYYKGSSLLKQMFYFIGQENFSTGLKSYFKKHAWTNTVFDDFVDEMVNAINQNGKADFDLKSLSKEWITKAGLNQIEAEWEEDSQGKIKSFNIRQSPCLPQHPNLQVHMIDILLVNENENSVLKNVMINASELTSVDSVVGRLSPKAVILNYNDWGYVKFLIEKRSLDYLKANLNQKIQDPLTKQLFYRSLVDLTRDSRISFPEYLDIVVNLLEHETNDEILSHTLRNVAGLINHYIPIKYVSQYATTMFELVGKLIANNLNDREIVLNLIELMINFAHSEEHTRLLREWLVSGPFVMKDGNKVEIPENLLNQDNRFSIVVLIHRSKEISLEEKTKILEAEVERDKNSDRSVRARCRCRAALPDIEVKKEVWDKIVNHPESDSLYNMNAYMSGFTSIHQLDLVEGFVKDSFLEDAALKVGKQEYFYINAFVMYCGPSLFVNYEVIKRLEALAEQAKDLSNMQRRLLELADDVKRYQKAQTLAESYLSKQIK